MTDLGDLFRGKRITVIGLGLLGKGLGDIRFLAQQGADLVVTDLKNAEALRPSLDALAQFGNIRYTLGRHDLADFKDRDLVFNGQSVPLDSPYLAEARKNNVPITNSTGLFSRLARERGATIVGVTGTRGKSTTAYLIAHIAREAGRHVLLGGNVLGVSTLALLPEVAQGTVVVLELDSWLLQGFREESISPDVSVFTTFFPDHMNYYRGDMNAYLDDKAQIFLHQSADNTLVLGEQAEPAVMNAYRERIHSHVMVAHAADIPSDYHLPIPGEHNRANAACAIAAARVLHIEESVIRQACETFAGVEGRLQFVRELHGVKIYNDTTATTPEATIVGLRALDPQGIKNISLIMGGSDKGLDMSALVGEIEQHCKRVFLLAGTGTQALMQTYAQLAGEPVFQSLEEALRAAVRAASSGDTVVLSPAFASFGMFKNEYDRGDQFVSFVRALA